MMDKDHTRIARQKFTMLSIRKAAERIKQQKQNYQQYQAVAYEQKFQKDVSNLAQYIIKSTDYGDTSSATRGKFSLNGDYFGSVGSSSQGKIWSIQHKSTQPAISHISTLIGSESKLNDITFHPKLGEIPFHAPNILTASTQGYIGLWTFNPNLQQQKNIKIKAHNDRVNRVIYDSSGCYFMGCSYDMSWSLWDTVRAYNVFYQKGHTSQIHTLCLHPDNSLVFTGDLRGNGMIWDLRTNKGICQYSQNDSILCSNFNPNGHHLAVAGKRNIISIFDLRTRKLLKSIPAHLKLISDLKYTEHGSTLVSVSHDNHIKIWHGLNYSLVSKEMTQLSKITSVDLNATMLATTMIDRKCSLWITKYSNAVKIQQNC